VAIETPRSSASCGCRSRGHPATAGGWQCAVPSWRFDLRIEADLLEELARVYGYNRLPVTRIRADLEMPRCPEARLALRPLRRRWWPRLQRGDYLQLCRPGNPASAGAGSRARGAEQPDLAGAAVMRSQRCSPACCARRSTTSTVSSPRVRLFETGLRFRPGADGLSSARLALLITGAGASPSPGPAPRERSISSTSRATSRRCWPDRRLRRAFSFVAGERAGLHPGQTALLLHHGDVSAYSVCCIRPCRSSSISTAGVRGGARPGRGADRGAYRYLPPCRATRRCAATSR
jgi:phenylalanyl-tRNA synthetase beta chain